MTYWQILNVLVASLFFGFLSAYIAQKKGRRPAPWFFVGSLFSLLGTVVVLCLPAIQRRSRSESSLPQRGESWMKMWYYLDPKTREQKGPLEFPDLAKEWKRHAFDHQSLVWGEGMKEWKTLSDLPDVVKEMESATKPHHPTRR